jgi:hypothetical protein
MGGVLAVLLLGLLTEAGQSAEVPRADIATMERSVDNQLKKINTENPFGVLGLTRGVYLEGYGAVFTAEVDLVTAPGISPFHPEFTKEDKARLRTAKLQRVATLRQVMREILLATAQSLDRVPVEEQIAIAVFLYHRTWEDQTGVPEQILMQAKRNALLDIAANRVERSALNTVVRERIN